MNYLTPQEEITSLSNELKAHKQIVHSARIQMALITEHCQDLTKVNQHLSQKNEGLKHAVLCLVIVMAGLLVSSAVILMRGAA